MAISIKKIIIDVFLLPVRFYKRFISPFLPKACLYEPSCSVYMMESIKRFGILRGGVLGVSRIFRCNGWFFNGGYDPVPERFSMKDILRGYRKFKNRS